MPFDQSDDLAVVCSAEQVTFPMTWHRPIFNRCRSLPDGNGVEDMAQLLGRMPRATDWTPGAQMLNELLFQDATGLNIKATIDRLVRHLGCLIPRLG